MVAGTLAVIGGGVIGLSVARRAAQDGWSVRVHRTEARGASWVAGGMLAPHSEGWPGEEALLAMGLESLKLWHTGFLDGLPADVVTAHESLVVAVDRADVADLKTVADWLSEQGHPVTVTTAARDVEPLLAQGIRHGFCAETELAVDNRALVSALERACAELGVQWAPPVTELAAVDTDQRVIANGIDAPALWPGLAVHPVKGEVLRLRWRKGCMPLPQRVIRARVHGRPVYLVPRGDGVVVGRVSEIVFDDKTYQALVKLDIEDGYKFPKDSSAKILTAGLLGEQYIGLEAGGDLANLAEGDKIARTQSATVLEDLINQFIYSKAAEGKDSK